jgi:hypothetical protein
MCMPWLSGQQGSFLSDMGKWLKEGKVQVEETTFKKTAWLLGRSPSRRSSRGPTRARWWSTRRATEYETEKENNARTDEVWWTRKKQVLKTKGCF